MQNGSGMTDKVSEGIQWRVWSADEYRKTEMQTYNRVKCENYIQTVEKVKEVWSREMSYKGKKAIFVGFPLGI